MRQKGFTLVELMVVVLIVGLLAAVGVPQYAAHVAAGKMADAQGALSNHKSQMEQYFQDRRTYLAADGTSCGVAPAQASTQFFTVACAATAETFSSTATAGANSNLTGLAFTLNHLGAKSTTLSGTTTCATGWAKKKTGVCP